MAGDTKHYQYMAIDEDTRLVYREMYDGHSTYSSLVSSEGNCILPLQDKDGANGQWYGMGQMRSTVMN